MTSGTFNAYGSYIQLSTLDDKEKPVDGEVKSPFLGTLPYRRFLCSKRDTVIVIVTLTLALCMIITTLAIGLPKIKEKELKYLDTSFPVSSSLLSSFNKAAVLTDGKPCAAIGRKILEKNGTAVDAAIATLFCNGVVTPQSMGLGGGFFMVVYLNESRKSDVIDARETAPASATKDMFEGNRTLSLEGGLSIAIPGELMGYQMAHKKYGKLNWTELVEPSIEICENGFSVSHHMANHLEKLKDKIMDLPSMREEFFNKETGQLYKENEILKRPELGKTLRTIARVGADALYDGELTENFVADIQECGGKITRKDLQQYQPQFREPIVVNIKDTESVKTLHTVPPPGSGLILSLILQLLQEYNITEETLSDMDSAILAYHRVVEAFKFGFAYRTELADPDYHDSTQLIKDLTSKEYVDFLRKRLSDKRTYPPNYYEAAFSGSDDHGTAQVSVLAPNGDAVSVTSTVNTYFGSLCRSHSTGIILNNEMDGFSSPNITNYFEEIPSSINFIEPGKRPISSMSPSVITDENGDVKMVIGAMGGTRIITAMAQSIIRTLWLNEDMKEATDALRIHHQLVPNSIQYEKGFPKIYLDKLKKYGHSVQLDDHGSEVLGILKVNEKVQVNVDHRKGGSADGF